MFLNILVTQFLKYVGLGLVTIILVLSANRTILELAVKILGSSLI
jgi:hypothetical protein